MNQANLELLSIEAAAAPHSDRATFEIPD